MMTTFVVQSREGGPKSYAPKKPDTTIGKLYGSKWSEESILRMCIQHNWQHRGMCSEREALARVLVCAIPKEVRLRGQQEALAERAGAPSARKPGVGDVEHTLQRCNLDALKAVHRATLAFFAVLDSDYANKPGSKPSAYSYMTYTHKEIV